MDRGSERKSEGGKRYPLNMRTTKETRERLEQAALASGRSLAQEVEFRIEQSFLKQSLLSEVLTLAWGPELANKVCSLSPTTSRLFSPKRARLDAQRSAAARLRELVESAATKQKLPQAKKE